MNPAELPLRDIHLPEPVSWWPMAPGWWWVIGLLLLASAVVTGIILYRRYRRSRLSYWLKPEFHIFPCVQIQQQEVLQLLLQC